jgi:hypothetical protein
VVAGAELGQGYKERSSGAATVKKPAVAVRSVLAELIRTVEEMAKLVADDDDADAYARQEGETLPNREPEPADEPHQEGAGHGADDP